MRVCSSDDIKTLLDGAPADLRLIAQLTLESLLRLSEAVNLRRENIGPTFATIVRSKPGRPRRVPLTAELRAELLARCCRASGCVFGLGKSGTPPSATAVSVAFSRLTTALGLSGVSHHALRYTSATVMVANGVLASRGADDWRLVLAADGRAVRARR